MEIVKEKILGNSCYKNNRNMMNHIWLFEISMMISTILINTGWGILFFTWMVVALITGSTGIFKRFSRLDTPKVFWIITFSWGLLSLTGFILLK